MNPFKTIPWNSGWPIRLHGQSPGTITYIGIGTNIGTHSQRVRLFRRALATLHALPATRLLAVSSIYETPPWGLLHQDSFYNAALAIHTRLRPAPLLRALKTIENQFGRKSRIRWGPREIDLDILLMGHLRYTTSQLTIPHPHLKHRPFAIVPLLEINPRLTLPPGPRLRPTPPPPPPQ